MNRARTTFMLIAINVVFFIISAISEASPINLTYLMGLSNVYFGPEDIYRFVSHFFAHGSISHIFFNMFALFIFGSQVEADMGPKNYLIFYLVSGTVSGILSFAVYTLLGIPVLMIGASGAIFAVSLAFAAFHPDVRLLIWGIIPVRAKVLVLVYAGISIVFQLTGAMGGVSHIGHLSGFVVGAVYLYIRYKINIFKVFFRR